MAIFTGVRVPQWNENGDVKQTVRELYSSFRALSEQLTYVLQNLDYENGAVSAEDLDTLSMQVSGQTSAAAQAAASANTHAQDALSAAQKAADALQTIQSTSEGYAAALADIDAWMNESDGKHTSFEQDIRSLKDTGAISNTEIEAMFAGTEG